MLHSYRSTSRPIYLWAIAQELGFSQACGFHRNRDFHIPEKSTYEWIIKKPKTLILDHFGVFLTQQNFFLKKSGFVTFLFYDSLTSFRKLEKSDEPYLRSCIVRKL